MPHLWLDESKRRSTLDLLRGNFLLIQNVHSPVRETTIAAIFNRLNLSVEVVTIADHCGIADEWRAQLNGLDDNELVLVRPDAFIAWKGIAGRSVDQLEAAITRVLSIT